MQDVTERTTKPEDISIEITQAKEQRGKKKNEEKWTEIHRDM